MNHVFGPVFSSRLGRSLGVDPIPFKTCNHSCVYCQLGRTRSWTTERAVFFDPDAILAEVDAALQDPATGVVDWVTLVGSGEPTLHAGLGRIVRGIAERTDLPVAVITNGALLSRPDVRGDLLAAHAVLPSLDWGSPARFRTVNRPAPGYSYEEHVEGLEAFRGVFPGKLWVEVMLVAGLNDGEQEMQALSDTLRRIAPDGIHLGVPTRPPAEAWVHPPGAAAMARASALLGAVAPEPPVVSPLEAGGDDPPVGEIGPAIRAIVGRHPMTARELAGVLPGVNLEAVRGALGELSRQGVVTTVQRFGREFIHRAEAQYGRAGPINWRDSS